MIRHEDDQQAECATRIMQMEPCITYVQGLDNKPTKSCYDSLLQVTSHAPAMVKFAAAMVKIGVLTGSL